MGIPDRVFNLAKGYLDRAVERWEQIDGNAQAELDAHIARLPASQSSSDPFERAQAKIEQTRYESQASRYDIQATHDVPPKPAHSTQSGPAGPQVDPNSKLAAAYQVLGVPLSADFDTVRQAYDRLKERAAPERFPEGSAEREQAKRIERRAGAAYMVLTDALNPADDRFDRLEL